MDLLILGRVTADQPQNYKGTDRTTPYYCDDLDERHTVNQAFLWYCNEGGQLGVVHDMARAGDLVEAYRQLQPPQYFDIVEVTKGQCPSGMESEFLGFDLSAGYSYSLLGWGLELVREPPDDLPKDDPLWVLQPLLRLTKQFFQPQLNLNGLFSDYDVAKFCLDCMLALQSIRPGLWENEEVKFEVVGLWKILTK